MRLMFAREARGYVRAARAVVDELVRIFADGTANRRQHWCCVVVCGDGIRSGPLLNPVDQRIEEVCCVDQGLIRLVGIAAAPDFTDEVTEMDRGAFGAYRGPALHLVGVRTYFGPLNEYLLVAAWRNADSVKRLWTKRYIRKTIPTS